MSISSQVLEGEPAASSAPVPEVLFREARRRRRRRWLATAVAALGVATTTTLVAHRPSGPSLNRNTPASSASPSHQASTVTCERAAVPAQAVQEIELYAKERYKRAASHFADHLITEYIGCISGGASWDPCGRGGCIAQSIVFDTWVSSSQIDRLKTQLQATGLFAKVLTMSVPGCSTSRAVGSCTPPTTPQSPPRDEPRGSTSGAASGTAVPATASYGRGRFVFKVAFVAKPTHSFHLTHRSKGVESGTVYRSRFASSYGNGSEMVAVVETTQRPSDACQVVHILLPGPQRRCPTADIRNRTIPPGASRVTVFHGVWRCPAKLCEGFLGAVAILQAKMLYYVGISGADRTTVEQVVGSLSP